MTYGTGQNRRNKPLLRSATTLLRAATRTVARSKATVLRRNSPNLVNYPGYIKGSLHLRARVSYALVS